MNGARYDPAPQGGGVDALRLYSTAARTGAATLTTGPALAVAPGQYRFTFDAPPNGLYYTAVSWRDTATSAAYVDTSGTLTFPLPAPPEAPSDGCLVAADAVGRDAGFTFPLVAAARDIITDAILLAQADVETYLRRALTPEIHSEVLVALGNPQVMATYIPQVGRTLYRSFDNIHYYIGHPLRADDMISLMSAVPYVAPVGYYDFPNSYTVTYLAGFEAQKHNAVMRFITAHAAALSRNHPTALSSGWVQRRVASKTLQGQSVTYESEAAAAKTMTPGFLSTLDALKRFRRPGTAAFQRPSSYDHPR